MNSKVGTIITANDYNGLVGYDPTTTENTFNAIWGVGAGKIGYGQPALPNLPDPAVALTSPNYNYDKITFPTSPGDDDKPVLSIWSKLVNSVNVARLHQGTSVPVILGTDYEPKDNVTVKGETLTRLISSVENLYAKSLNAAAQGTSVSYPMGNGGTWRNSLEFTHIVTFADGEAARYFFNCGGQLALTFSSPPGLRIDALMNSLGTNCGTLVISSPNTETIEIVGKKYQGVTRVDGKDPDPVDPLYTTAKYGVQTFHSIVPSAGYYGMTTEFQEIFKQSVGGFQTAEPRYNYYDGSYISVKVKTNNPQGTNGDNGNVITIVTTWDQVPDGLQVTAGTKTTLTVRPPLLRSGMVKSWGTPVVNSTIIGT